MARTAQQMADDGKELLVKSPADLMFIWDSISKSLKVIQVDNLIGDIFWEELGRTTLGAVADTITVGFTAKKYLRIIATGIPSGSLDCYFRFNGDSGNNYAHRKSDSGAADGTVVSTNSIDTFTGAAAQLALVQLDVINILAQEKLVIGHSTISGAAGAANAPSRKEFGSKWANTAAQINSVTFLNGSSGDFAAGSEVVVLGHD